MHCSFCVSCNLITNFVHRDGCNQLLRRRCHILSFLVFSILGGMGLCKSVACVVHSVCTSFIQAYVAVATCLKPTTAARTLAQTLWHYFVKATSHFPPNGYAYLNLVTSPQAPSPQPSYRTSRDPHAQQDVAGLSPGISTYGVPAHGH